MEKKCAVDLLMDDSFVVSILDPTKETDDFWRELIEDGEIDEEEFSKAKSILLNPTYLNEKTDLNKRIDKLWKRIDKTINRNKKLKKLHLISSSIAVACVLGFIFFILTNNRTVEYTNANILNSDYAFNKVPKVLHSSDQIELIINNEKEIEIESDTVHIKNTSSGIHINNDTIIRDNLEEKIDLLQLSVPYGKRSKIDLIDGSTIIVNAGTRVIYPSKFVGNKREIYVDGEIYADIAHDKDKPFIVRTDNLSLQVLGTAFNINAYENESDKFVVLVKGSVKVIPHNKNIKGTILKPNEKYYIDKDNSKVEIVQPDNYTSWIQGVYRFKGEPLKHILSRISKYYGVTILCETSIQNIICTGSLDLKDDINALLYDISLTTSLEYTYIDDVYKFNKTEY